MLGEATTDENSVGGGTDSREPVAGKRAARWAGGMAALSGGRRRTMAELSMWILSICSFAATAKGMAIITLGDSSSTLWMVIGVLLAVVVAFAIQAPMVEAAFRVKAREGRLVFPAIYLVFATISITFSYAGLFEWLTGGIINSEQREAYFNEYNGYLLAVRKDIGAATALASEARAEMQHVQEFEKTVGGSSAMELSSPYLRYLRREGRLVIPEGVKGGGEGRVYHTIGTLVSMLDEKVTRLEGLETKLDAIAREGRAVNADVTENLRRIERTIDWNLVTELLSTGNRPYQAPPMPAAFDRLGGSTGMTRKDSAVQWVIDAVRAVWKEWDSLYVGLPLGIAMFMDGYVLFVGFVFRDKRVMVGGNANRQLADLFVERAFIEPDRLKKAITVILHALDRRGAHQKERWYLQVREVQEMPELAQDLVASLAKCGLIEQGRLKPQYVMDSEIKDALGALLRGDAPTSPETAA